MLRTILKNHKHSITFKITFERPEIQDVNVFNSTSFLNTNEINDVFSREDYWYQN